MKRLVVLQLYFELVALLLLLQQGGHVLVEGTRLELSNEGVQILELVGNLFGVALVSVLARILVDLDIGDLDSIGNVA